MTGYVIDQAGVRWQLPPLLAWQLDYTAGVPCDSFWLRFLWKQGTDTDPREWVEFQAEDNGERVFTGLVDECERTRDSGGEVMEISGRGMSARLLDNEALGQDYETATLADILRDHVTPYGITVESRLHKGTCVTILFPRIDDPGDFPSNCPPLSGANPAI